MRSTVFSYVNMFLFHPRNIKGKGGKGRESNEQGPDKMWKRKGLPVPFTNNDYDFYFSQPYFLFQMAIRFVILVTLLLEEERLLSGWL